MPAIHTAVQNNSAQTAVQSGFWSFASKACQAVKSVFGHCCTVVTNVVKKVVSSESSVPKQSVQQRNAQISNAQHDLANARATLNSVRIDNLSLEQLAQLQVRIIKGQMQVRERRDTAVIQWRFAPTAEVKQMLRTQLTTLNNQLQRLVRSGDIVAARIRDHHLASGNR